MKKVTDLPKRKATRLKGYDYSAAGYYFVTLCTKQRKKILSNIVGVDAHIDPCGNSAEIELTHFGSVVDKYINSTNNLQGVYIDKYIIMPDHIHIVVKIDGGSMWASTPTKSVSSVVRSLKTLTTKEIGQSIFQRSYNDHIIRGEQDYLEIWNYIENNALKHYLHKSNNVGVDAHIDPKC